VTGRPEPEYRSAFIAVAGDCPATRSREPDKPGTIGALEFDLIAGAPYRYTQADVLWHVHLQRGGLGTRHSADYERLATDPNLIHWNAMRNKRA